MEILCAVGGATADLPESASSPPHWSRNLAPLPSRRPVSASGFPAARYLRDMSRDYALRPFRAPVDLQIDYARELNPQQLAAVTAAPGPALVLAGAGAGKTRTLIYRVAFLLEQGIPPERLLLLTFTNKAAHEMMRRVTDLLGGDLSTLWGGTFHAIGHRVLRRHAEQLGHSPSFTILDREDAKDLVNACLDSAEIDVKATRFPKADVLGDIFSLAVNTGRPVRQVLEAQYDYFSTLAPQIEDLHRRYAERKRATGVMDFDDLLALWLQLLREHADIRELYQRRFQFVLVDEYQDTNRLQSDLIDLLAERHHNVMVVGDDSQSIYSWRGADFHNILRFPERYPGAAIYKIETNYRSTPEILNLANAAIAANVHQFAKQLTPARKSGPKPILVTCQDGGEQAAFVAQRVLELRDEGINLNEMAVLYRSHFHALELQLELTRRNIPFSITSGIRFFEQAHIKDVAAYLKLVCNPRDELAFKRLARMLPGIGGKTADKLWTRFSTQLSEGLPAAASSHRRGEALSNSELGTRNSELAATSQGSTAPSVEPASNSPEPLHSAPAILANALQACAASVPKKAAVPWAQLVATMSQLDHDTLRNQPGELIALVLEADYEDYLKERYTNYRSRLEDLEQLATFAQQFATTQEFLAQLALLSNLEADEDRPARADDEQLRLSTIHQAKGLEFGVVFVIMLCDGLFPATRSLDSAEGEEEERRLFYVAITRSKNELYLSHPLIRAVHGGGEVMQKPSRFLAELPPGLREEWNLRPYTPYA
jgi:DNA helicase-2/ATP-dependent DNA helicase PcrA